MINFRVTLVAQEYHVCLIVDHPDVYYMCNEKLKLTNILSIAYILNFIQHIVTYPSVTPNNDNRTPKRTIQHFLNNLNNIIHKSHEYTDTLCHAPCLTNRYSTALTNSKDCTYEQRTACIIFIHHSTLTVLILRVSLFPASSRLSTYLRQRISRCD